MDQPVTKLRYTKQEVPCTSPSGYFRAHVVVKMQNSSKFQTFIFRYVTSFGFMGSKCAKQHSNTAATRRSIAMRECIYSEQRHVAAEQLPVFRIPQRKPSKWLLDKYPYKPLRLNNPRVYECKRSELRIPEEGTEFSLLRKVQTGSAAHPDFYSMGTRVLSQG